MKKKIIILLTISTLFISGCSCSIKNNDGDNKGTIDHNNENLITNENVIKEKEIDGIILENTTFHYDNGVTTIVTKVTNNKDTEFVLNNYKIVITDESGILLASLTNQINVTLAPKEEVSYPMTFSEIDTSTAANVEYFINVTE